jgi:lipopolysaccharide transport system permease protein
VPDAIFDLPAERHGSTQKNGVRAGEPIPGLTYHAARPWWRLVDLPEMWAHRELLWMLGQRDLQVRYRQTFLGIAWCLLQPLTSMAIFATLFGLLGRKPAVEGVPYGLVALCGLVPWQMFSSIVSQAGGSLVANQGMIGKVYFPRLLLPVAVVLPNLVDFAVSLGIVLAGLVVWGVWPTWHIVGLPLAVGLIVAAGLAAGIGVAAVNAMYRDATFLVSFVLQAGFFVSPVVYETAALIPPRWQWLYALNPLAGIIEFFRWCVLPDRSFSATGLGLAVAIVAGVLVASLAYFRAIETTIADSI